MKIGDKVSFCIFGWMLSFGLNSNQLLTYALIYSKSQAGAFCCSLSYIASWLNTTNGTAVRIIKTLEEMKLVEKTQMLEKGRVVNYYKAIVPDYIN